MTHFLTLAKPFNLSEFQFSFLCKERLRVLNCNLGAVTLGARVEKPRKCEYSARRGKKKSLLKGNPTASLNKLNPGLPS